MLNQYDIEATVIFSKRSKPSFAKEISYTSPSGVKVIIQSNNYSDLVVNMKVNAAEDNYAKNIAENELSSICNFLSFYLECSITDYRVSNWKCYHNDGSGGVVSMSDMFCAVDSDEVRKMLSEQNITTLTN